MLSASLVSLHRHRYWKRFRDLERITEITDLTTGLRLNNSVVALAGPASLSCMVAFDGMRVPLALLPQLPALLPAVRSALQDVEAQ